MPPKTKKNPHNYKINIVSSCSIYVYVLYNYILYVLYYNIYLYAIIKHYSLFYCLHLFFIWHRFFQFNLYYLYIIFIIIEHVLWLEIIKKITNVRSIYEKIQPVVCSYIVCILYNVIIYIIQYTYNLHLFSYFNNKIFLLITINKLFWTHVFLVFTHFFFFHIEDTYMHPLIYYTYFKRVSIVIHD